MKRVFCVVILSCITLVACYPPNSVQSTSYYEPYFMAKNVVPFAMNGDIEKSLSRVYLEDTDDFGRRLFRYDQYSVMLNKPISIWLICQFADNEFTYYYEDSCYYIIGRDKSLSNDVLTEFKSANDWNQSINIGKCTSLEYFSGISEDVLSEKLVQKALHDYFKPNEDRSFGYDALEVKDNRQMFLVCEHNTFDNVETSSYLVIINIESVEVVSCLEIPLKLFDLNGDINEISKYIKQFKQENDFK